MAFTYQNLSLMANTGVVKSLDAADRNKALNFWFYYWPSGDTTLLTTSTYFANIYNYGAKEGDLIYMPNYPTAPALFVLSSLGKVVSLTLAAPSA